MEKPQRSLGGDPKEAQTVGRASVRVNSGVLQLSFFLPYLEYQRKGLARNLPWAALRVACGLYTLVNIRPVDIFTSL